LVSGTERPGLSLPLKASLIGGSVCVGLAPQGSASLPTELPRSLPQAQLSY